MNSMTNMAEYGKKPHTALAERIFFPVDEKNVTFAYTKYEWSSVLYDDDRDNKQGEKKVFFDTFCNLKSATDK